MRGNARPPIRCFAPTCRRPARPDGEAEFADHLEALGSAFAALISGPAFVERARHLRKAYPVRRHVYDLPSPRGEAAFRVRDDAPKLVRRGPEWMLKGGNGAVPVSTDERDWIAWIAERPHFSEGDLAGAFPSLGDAERVRFLDEMTGHGVIEAV